MHLLTLLLPTLFHLHSALALPSNSSLLQLPSYNTTLSAWPPVPYTTTYQHVQITVNEYGRTAAYPLKPDIIDDFHDILRRLQNVPPFTRPPLTLSGQIVTVKFNLSDPSRLTKFNMLEAIAALRIEMRRCGAVEISRAVLRAKRVDIFDPLAELTVEFSRVDASE
ncbi:hypothetical protein ACLMJK_001874 [Lecanora helva]